MNDYLLPLIRKYEKLGVLIDTNIFLLYLIGSINSREIRAHKRISMFSEPDFDIVSKFIDFFEVKVTTPHILTEVSNLLKNELHRNVLRVYLGNLLEVYTSSIDIANNSLFELFGLTDIAILKEAQNKFLVITDDGRLGDYLRKSGVDVITMKEIRAVL